MNYDLEGRVAVVTGGGGVICGEIAKAFAREGAKVAIWDISLPMAQKKADEIRAKKGAALAIECNVVDRGAVEAATKETLATYETVDILVNGAGGGRKEACTSDQLEFFDLAPESMMDVMALNYMSAVIPSQVIGRIFAKKKSGVILNISSIAGISPVTRQISYSNGKAATNNFTQWLAVHMAQNYSSSIRVNAIAPGFVLTTQNRFLLIDEKTGNMTPRGQQIVDNCPMGRYGEPTEIAGAALWLVSDYSSFVTGAVIPVDGGFTAFCGV